MSVTPPPPSEPSLAPRVPRGRLAARLAALALIVGTAVGQAAEPDSTALRADRIAALGFDNVTVDSAGRR